MSFLSRYGKWKKRVGSAVLVASLAISMPVLSQLGRGNETGLMQTYASSYSQQREDAEDKRNEAEDKKNEAENNLNQVQGEVDDIEEQQNQIANEIQVAQKELQGLLADQEELKLLMNETQARINQANIDLANAREEEAQGYESMKLRIQFMYENGADSSIWSAIIESNGIADMLNRIEYVSDIHATDRRLMDKYKAAVQSVEALTIALADEMNRLGEQMDTYQTKQSQVEVLIAELETKQDKNSTLLATAKAKMEEYEATISEQGRIIQQQEALAAQYALLEEQEKQQQQQQQQQQQNSSGSSSNTSSGSTNYQGGGAGASGLGSADYLTDPSADPAFTSGVSPDELVSYALQWVGNPYVWGGNSLTNGVDCSGFVHEVYEHFGFNLPRYSQAFKTVGQPVSFQNIKAGDIVVYPGHVAIYIGNGKIVEAQSSNTGITSYRSVECHTITAIRRVL